MTWTERAICREIGIEAFFPSEETGSDYRAVRVICQRCPVRPDCLAAVMEHEGPADRHNRHGMWAGLSPNQRYRMHLAQRREAA